MACQELEILLIAVSLSLRSVKASVDMKMLPGGVAQLDTMVSSS